MKISEMVKRGDSGDDEMLCDVSGDIADYIHIIAIGRSLLEICGVVACMDRDKTIWKALLYHTEFALVGR